jgi:hypothetical protein
MRVRHLPLSGDSRQELHSHYWGGGSLQNKGITKIIGPLHLKDLITYPYLSKGNINEKIKVLAAWKYVHKIVIIAYTWIRINAPMHRINIKYYH